MGFQPKIAVINSNSTEITICDNTGTYNATTNPTGYGAPNPLKADITAILLQQAVIGNVLPAASSLSSPDRTKYLNGTGVPSGQGIFKDGVYDIHALIGYAGSSQLSAVGNSSQFTLSNASVVFLEAVGFTVNSDSTHKLYRIDRTKTLNTSGGYTIETLPVLTTEDITIYYEAQIYTLVYNQGEACLLSDIAKFELDCDCENSEETNKLMQRYAEYLSMINRFNVTKDYQGAHKLAVKLQNDCDSRCFPCSSTTSIVSSGSGEGGTSSGSTGVPPTIITQPSNESLNIGQNASFTVIATGTSPLSYQWKKNGVDITGATDATLNILNVQNSDAASYTVLVSNPYGSVLSAVATLAITGALIPITITLQPISVVGVAGGDYEFVVAATGSATITYQWRKDGTPISGEVSATLSLANVDSGDEADYDVVLTNGAGSVTSNVATLSLGVIALWGWKNTIPTGTGDITVLQASGAFTPGGTLTADFRANSTPLYLIMAEPSTEPAKTKWFGDATNYGDIGNINTDLFGPPTIIGSYRVYISVYKTYNTQSTIQFKVS